MNSRFGWSIFSVIFLTTFCTQAGQAQTTSPSVLVQTKQMLINLKKGLGKLQPSQDRVFQEEVLLQPDFFADADEETLRAFLTFPQGSAHLEVKTDPVCLACKNAENEIRKTAEASLLRRGFKLDSVSPALRSIVFVGYSAPDVSDTGHADEKHLVVKVTQKWGSDGEDIQSLALNENSPITSNFQKVWNASLSGMGLKSYRAQMAVKLQNSTEYWVQINPLREYSVLGRILDGLRVRYAESYPYRMARGVGTIRVKGAQKREELIEYLRGLKLESGKISKVLPAQGSENGVEVKIE